MLLDSTEFAYAYRRGWEDYFEPFCVAPDSVDPQRIETWFRFNPIEEREVFMSLLRSEPDRLRFGSTEIAPFEAIMRHFMRLIFRLKDDCVDEISRLTKRLELTERYVAIHVRRGDKVGDEDVAYAVERYFDALGPALWRDRLRDERRLRRRDRGQQPPRPPLPHEQCRDALPSRALGVRHLEIAHGS